jgi:hypothetical protein
MRRVISIIVAVATALLGVSALQWLFPLYGWGWIVTRWLGSIAVGFYIGNLFEKDAKTRRWFGSLLFFIHAGLWITSMHLLLRLVPTERVRLSDFTGPIPVLTKIAFAAESHAGIVIMAFALLLFAIACLSFRRDLFSPRQYWITQVVALAPVFIMDVLVFVGLVVGWVSAINSIQ